MKPSICKPLHGVGVALWVLVALSGWIDAPAGEAGGVEDLLDLPIEALFQVTISTASKIEETVDVAPATIYVITEEQIRRLGLRDLKDILALVPGVDTADPHFFLLGGQRGFVGSFSKTLLLINGREVNNLVAGETFISNQFRSFNIKQVEIIAGPGSALYGANALAGVINIITKTAEDLDGVEVSVLGGNRETAEVNLVAGTQRGETRANGSFSWYRSDGEDYAGFLSQPDVASPLAENNAYRFLPNEFGYQNEEQAYAVSLALEHRNLYAGTEFYRNESGRGTSGIEWDYTRGEDVREFWMNYLGYKREGLLNGALDTKVEYRYYWEQFWGNNTEGEGPLQNPFTGETLTVDATPEDVEAYRGFYSNRRLDDSEKQVGILESTYRVNDRNTLILGMNVEYADIVGAAFSRTEGVHPVSPENQIRPEFSNLKWGTYAQHQVRLLEEALAITLGARYDDHEEYGDTFNPRCGVVYQATDRTIFKLLYGEAFREPTVFELQNNNAIEPTEMQTVEVGWHQYLGTMFKNEAVLFYNEADDVIVSDSTELGGISNRGSLEAEGLENVLHFNYKRVKGFLNYTYTMAELDEPDRPARDVTDIPTHKANLAAMVDVGDRYSVGLVVRYRGEVDTEYRDRILRVDDYTAVDLTVNVLELPWFTTEARLDIVAKNIFAEESFHPEPRAPAVVKHPQEEQTVQVRLTVKL